jgi:hypothetical protein
MSSSGTLKIIGIFAAIVTVVTGTVASNFASQSATYQFATTITTIAFFAWVLSALVLLVRLCRWLYATRASRTRLKTVLWILAVVWASIVLPLIVRVPPNYSTESDA